MKKKLSIIIGSTVAGFAAYVAFHPGVAYSETQAASAPATAFAPVGDYTIDPAHTSLYFEITHLGLSQVHGRISDFKGKIHEDAKDLSKCSVELTAKVTSIDTAVAARDAHLRTADFFDVEKYPDLTFKSTKISKAKVGYIATGDLTIKGKTKQISIPFKHTGPLALTVGDMTTRVGVIAEPIVIKRSDFGVGNQMTLPGGVAGVSDDVIVRLSLEATLDK